MQNQKQWQHINSNKLTHGEVEKEIWAFKTTSHWFYSSGVHPFWDQSFIIKYNGDRCHRPRIIHWNNLQQKLCLL